MLEKCPESVGFGNDSNFNLLSSPCLKACHSIPEQGQGKLHGKESNSEDMLKESNMTPRCSLNIVPVVYLLKSYADSVSASQNILRGTEYLWHYIAQTSSKHQH